MLTGRCPFDIQNEFELMKAQIGSTPCRRASSTRPSRSGSSRPSGARIAKDPAQRFQSASEFRGGFLLKPASPRRVESTAGRRRPERLRHAPHLAADFPPSPFATTPMQPCFHTLPQQSATHSQPGVSTPRIPRAPQQSANHAVAARPSVAPTQARTRPRRRRNPLAQTLTEPPGDGRERGQGDSHRRPRRTATAGRRGEGDAHRSRPAGAQQQDSRRVRRAPPPAAGFVPPPAGAVVRQQEWIYIAARESPRSSCSSWSPRRRDVHVSARRRGASGQARGAGRRCRRPRRPSEPTSQPTEPTQAAQPADSGSSGSTGSDAQVSRGRDFGARPSSPSSAYFGRRVPALRARPFAGHDPHGAEEPPAQRTPAPQQPRQSAPAAEAARSAARPRCARSTSKTGQTASGRSGCVLRR